jgi:hypothetical protein
MAKVTRFRLNHAGMAELLKSDGVRAIVTAHAEPVLAAAKADPHDDTGAYEAGLVIEQDTTDRVAVRVKGTDWKSGVLEARYGILQRALGAGG